MTISPLDPRYLSAQAVLDDATQSERWPQVLASLRAEAEAGQAWAQCLLGESAFKGLGRHPDEAEAVRYYRLAADQGEAEAQFQLALHLASGTGVLRDEPEALHYARLALAQGYQPDPTKAEGPLQQAMAFLLSSR